MRADDRKDPLLSALGKVGQLPEVRECTPVELAHLTLAHLGPVTLSTLSDALSATGLEPPGRWRGSDAIDFVASLGFPESFAAASTAKREAEEWISGPIPLGPLHDYQQEVLEEVGALFASGSGRRRAVVSLPTGGGKTRCTVESAVRHILTGSGPNKLVLWIAQSDELCEQAVQSFRQVWHNVGSVRTELRIIRLWGGNKNPMQSEPGKPVVVVSTIQTLATRRHNEALDWMRAPAMVVFDECHHAIARSYTGALSWLDADAHKGAAPTTNTANPPAPAKEEPLILGLSATPFRMDDDESRWLAGRFDKRWFPKDQQDLHQRLISRGMLSKAEYEPLESEAALTDSEEERFGDLLDNREGLEFDRLLEEINQRLAGDRKRNELLLDRIARASETSILFFANSVPHAEEIATRLNLRGIPAAAINGDTAPSSRRYFIDRFQTGDLRVLCNHSVLTTGFDAPKVEMVLIARQVFSPVRYMQMAGRGLRGEKNGGTPKCRIVTVVDNLGRFQDKHAYHYCDRYFSSSMNIAEKSAH